MLTRTEDDVTRLEAWLLGSHRREDKPMWWRYFNRLEASPEELADDADCIANVTRTATAAEKIKKSLLVEYQFDPDQDAKLEAGDHVYFLDGTEKPPRRAIDSL